MSGRIESIFRGLRANGRGGLMPYVTGGHPSLDVTERVLPAIDEAGADIVEVGIPFSDPIADGPVIAAAMHEALVAGATPEHVFDVVRRVRDRVSAGLVAMVSHSIVDRRGVAAFIDEAADAGFDGFIVPDIDLDVAEDAARHAESRGLSFTMLVAPTSTDARIAQLCAVSRGFVYLLARVGITGEQSEAPEVEARVAQLRQHTDLPIAVGFGISERAHVAAVNASADASIVGSALVRRMSDADDPVAAATEFVRGLRGSD